MKTRTIQMALFVWLAALGGAPALGGVRLQFIQEGCSVTPEERQELQAMVNLEWDYLRRVFRTQEDGFFAVFGGTACSRSATGRGCFAPGWGTGLAREW
jgi:hypothetical protein